MASKIRRLYECGNCYSTHESEDSAIECCAPDIAEVYECPTCKDTHYARSEAESCCAVEPTFTRCPTCARDYSSCHINHFAVTVAGHCNTCNPFFSPDQQIAIEDQYFRDGRGDAGLNS